MENTAWYVYFRECIDRRTLCMMDCVDMSVCVLSSKSMIRKFLTLASSSAINIELVKHLNLGLVGHSGSCRIWNGCVAIHCWSQLSYIQRDPWIIFPRKAEGLVRHMGGCHCGAIRFEVWSAVDLHVFDCKYGLFSRSRGAKRFTLSTKAWKSVLPLCLSSCRFPFSCIYR